MIAPRLFSLLDDGQLPQTIERMLKRLNQGGKIIVVDEELVGEHQRGFEVDLRRRRIVRSPEDLNEALGCFMALTSRDQVQRIPQLKSW